MNIFLIATAWGPKLGGINSFNEQFSVGLAEALGSRGKVFCGVPYATFADVQQAKKKGVTLISADSEGRTEYSTDDIEAMLKAFSEDFSHETVDWWIGHDFYTGLAAEHCKSKHAGSFCCILMHMNYAEYLTIHAENPELALKKEQIQRRLFRNADIAIANGPVLRDALTDILQLQQEAPMVIPGFPELSLKRPTDRLAAISIGRQDKKSDLMKLGVLAVTAFGQAISFAWSANSSPILKGNPRLCMVGIGDIEETIRLKSLLETSAERKVNFAAIPFSQDREMILEQLSESNLAFMLSWHEGFGLVAWEAIGMGVPLILSTNSGVWQLLCEVLGEKTAVEHVHIIEIQGSFSDLEPYSESDLKSVEYAIEAVSGNLAGCLSRAGNLRKLLEEKISPSWAKAASKTIELLSDFVDDIDARILIVEDDEDYRNDICAYLTDFGFESLDEAENLAEAESAIFENTPNLILLDLDLGDENGEKIIGTLSKTAPQTKVVIVSGQDISAATEAFLKMGVCDVIPKSHFFRFGAQKIFHHLRFATPISEGSSRLVYVIDSQLQVLENYLLTDKRLNTRAENTEMQQKVDSLFAARNKRDFDSMLEVLENIRAGVDDFTAKLLTRSLAAAISIAVGESENDD